MHKPTNHPKGKEMSMLSEGKSRAPKELLKPLEEPSQGIIKAVTYQVDQCDKDGCRAYMKAKTIGVPFHVNSTVRKNRKSCHCA